MVVDCTYVAIKAQRVSECPLCQLPFALSEVHQPLAELRFGILAVPAKLLLILNKAYSGGVTTASQEAA
jgi:hypothetical protein